MVHYTRLDGEDLRTGTHRPLVYCGRPSEARSLLTARSGESPARYQHIQFSSEDRGALGILLTKSSQARKVRGGIATCFGAFIRPFCMQGRAIKKSGRHWCPPMRHLRRRSHDNHRACSARRNTRKRSRATADGRMRVYPSDRCPAVQFGRQLSGDEIGMASGGHRPKTAVPLAARCRFPFKLSVLIFHVVTALVTTPPVSHGFHQKHSLT